MKSGPFKHLIWIAAAFILFAAPAVAAPVTILMIGTSLTQGYGLPPSTEIPAVLQAKLKAAGIDARVINAGVSGDTSAGGLARLDWSLADHPNAAIIVLYRAMSRNAFEWDFRTYDKIFTAPGTRA